MCGNKQPTCSALAIPPVGLPRTRSPMKTCSPQPARLRDHHVSGSRFGKRRRRSRWHPQRRALLIPLLASRYVSAQSGGRLELTIVAVEQSNSLMFSNKSAIVYGGAGGEDSQTASFAGNSRGTMCVPALLSSGCMPEADSSPSRSTGFKKSAAGATKLGGTAPTKAKSNALAPQRSKLSGMRRRDFS